MSTLKLAIAIYLLILYNNGGYALWIIYNLQQKLKDYANIKI